MLPDKTPITRMDLNVVTSAISSLRELMENKMSHLENAVDENTAWRQEFMNESGPWRRMDNRVIAVEYLARSVKWVVGVMLPIATWAALEIIRMIWASLQGGP